MINIFSWIKKHGFWILLIIGFVLGIYRLGYFLYSPIPLGYDAGIYKGIFIEYSKVLGNFDFSLLQGWVKHEPLIGIIMAILSKIGANPDWWLTRGIGIINLIPGFLIFFLLKKESKWIGAICSLLYWTSIVGYELFWRGYFKQIIAVNIMLLLIFFIKKNKILPQSILFIIIILLHKHTALYTGAILLGYWIFYRYTNKKIPLEKIIFLFFAGLIGLTTYIPIGNEIISDAIKSSGSVFFSKTSGVFMTVIDYIKFQWLFIIFSLFGFIINFIKKKIDVLSIGYIVGLVWIILNIVNYNRTIVFLDIFVIIFAGYGLLAILNIGKDLGYQKTTILFISIILFGTTLHYLGYVSKKNIPLINEAEFFAIKNIHTFTEKNAIIINTHRNYSPWIIGWSERDYINPGMSDLDIRTRENRNYRRLNDGKIKCEMLDISYSNIQRPLYMWIGEQQFKENFSGGNCFSLIKSGTGREIYKIHQNNKNK